LPDIAGAAGRVKPILAPHGSAGTAHSEPPCASMIDRLIASPMPRP